MITSLDNKEIKKYASLKQKKYREQEKMFLVEGEHLIKEAEKANILQKVILTENKEIDTSTDVLYVSKEVMKKLSSLDTPPEMIGICEIKKEEKTLGDKLLILDDIQDPGNLGTIIRSAMAFNIDSIILSENTVDLYNPKVVRATQGLSFHINTVRCDIKEKINELRNNNYEIYVTNVEDGEEIKNIKTIPKKLALVMGNEGNGVSEEIKKLGDKNIYIKTNPLVESLNVGVATSILLYELDKEKIEII